MPSPVHGFRRAITFATIFLALSVASGCSPATPTPAPAPSPAAAIHYTYEVVNTFPHDRGAFTEGLVLYHHRLFESTGLNGQSTLREENLQTGEVLRQIPISADYFGEGIAILGSKIYQLTWQNHKGFVYDLDTFHLEKEFAYTGEGWALTTDGQSLIMSDGTSHIRYLDPETFAVKRTITVTLSGTPMSNINELEYVKGEIYANVWQTDYVIRIDPQTGNVVGVINFAGLLPPQDRTPDTDVLNGIAYDDTADRLFVTGKKWPLIFEVRLHPVNQGK